MIDFGKAATDGSFLLERTQRGSWLLTPFPRDLPFTVQIVPALLNPALPRRLYVQALDIDNRPLDSVPTMADGKGRVRFRVNTIEHAVRYCITGRP